MNGYWFDGERQRACSRSPALGLALRGRLLAASRAPARGRPTGQDGRGDRRRRTAHAVVARIGRSLQARRARLPGAGCPRAASGSRRAEGRQGRSDRPAAAGRIRGAAEHAAGPARAGARGARRPAGGRPARAAAAAGSAAAGRERKARQRPHRVQPVLARCSSRGAIARRRVDDARTAYRVAQEEHKAARQLLEKGTIARAGGHRRPRRPRSAGSKARVVEANIQLADSTLHRALRRRDRAAVRRAEPERPGEGAGRPVPGRRRDRHRRRRAGDGHGCRHPLGRHRANGRGVQRRAGPAVSGPHPRDRAGGRSDDADLHGSASR